MNISHKTLTTSQLTSTINLWKWVSRKINKPTLWKMTQMYDLWISSMQNSTTGLIWVPSNISPLHNPPPRRHTAATAIKEPHTKCRRLCFTARRVSKRWVGDIVYCLQLGWRNSVLCEVVIKQWHFCFKLLYCIIL